MKNNDLTLGSLFDGSGGFPLGGILSGITPLWSSEIEPFPIRVTTKRLPQIQHYGDVSKLNGGELPPVDIITFGSPCQNMSIAGKREGLNGEQSVLFYQAVRIVKEMRCATNGKYPRYIVWENVPGAFSSNKGEDFRCVLEEVCKIGDNTVSVPRSEKWRSAGEIVGNGFSVAWRVLDAQYWGVPQRRKRIYLVADFDSECAGKILFESEGLSGYSAEGFRSWQRAAGSAENGSGKSISKNINSAGFCTEHSANSRSIGFEEETSPTLRAGTVPAAVFENHSQDTRYKQLGEVAPTVSSTYGTGGNNQPFVVEKTFDVRFTTEGTKNARQNCYETDTARTIDTGGNAPDSNQGGVAVVFGICSKDSNSMKSDNPHSGFYEAETARTLDTNGGNPTCNQGGMAVVSIEGNGARPSHKGAGFSEEDVSYTLNATEQHGVAYGIDRAAFNQGKNAQYNIAVEEEIEPTMVAKGANAVACRNLLSVSAPTYSTSKASFFTRTEEELANTLVATDYKDPPLINDTEYIVRRLTPTECARLQGFPDWWCDGLETESPTDEDLKFWREVFETHRKITGSSSKEKPDKQILKWLKNPRSDSAEYKMWGNGVALPCVIFVLAGIVWLNSSEWA